MNLFRLFILGMIVWFVLRMLKSWRVQVTPREPPPSRRGSKPDSERFEPMAQCYQCGVHLPQRALTQSGRCSTCDRSR